MVSDQNNLYISDIYINIYISDRSDLIYLLYSDLIYISDSSDLSEYILLQILKNIRLPTKTNLYMKNMKNVSFFIAVFFLEILSKSSDFVNSDHCI